ncbi:hypothetical protein [Bacillus sp. SG-1]|uniref:hypothetical protein n=1 Tax=Bacillus sp. SG-1 TaxID=161544 RepID=UPI0006943437|nr:hypothetical protein [Bacillus sp. SG-1]
MFRSLMLKGACLKMKNRLIPALLSLLLILTGCNFLENKKPPLEMVAFNSLTSEEKNKIPVSPKDSIVDKVTADKQLGKQLGDEYVGDTLYTVTFQGTEDETNGRLVVYININKETVIGKGYEKNASPTD